jgi:branched-chain amino acid transport system ATP-binding protein
MLEIEDLHTYYGESHVLQGISLRVAAGQVIAILGRNGVGKTTLIRSIVNFTPPRRGQVRFGAHVLTGLPPEKIARLGIGVVPQGHRVFRSLTVKENLLVGARAANGPGWTLARVFELFPRLAERAQVQAGSLSGGEQKMLATSQALMTNPELLLLDEPTEGLAPFAIRGLGQTIQQLKSQGMSMLLVEQHLRFALELADWVYVMSKGRIVFESAPDELDRNADVKRFYLGV